MSNKNNLGSTIDDSGWIIIWLDQPLRIDSTNWNKLIRGNYIHSNFDCCPSMIYHMFWQTIIILNTDYLITHDFHYHGFPILLRLFYIKISLVNINFYFCIYTTPMKLINLPKAFLKMWQRFGQKSQYTISLNSVFIWRSFDSEQCTNGKLFSAVLSIPLPSSLYLTTYFHSFKHASPIEIS